MMNNALSKQNGILEIIDDILLITDFTIKESEIVDYFKSQPDNVRLERFNTVLRTGVWALKSTEISEKVDYVEKKFNKLGTEFDKSFGDSFGENGVLHKIIDENFGENGILNKIIDANFGENGVLLKEILDPNNETSPLYKLKSQINQEIKDLRDSVGAKKIKDEVIEKTTLKGPYFESYCKDLLSKSAKIYGDMVEDFTTVSGDVKGSKKGDLLVTLKESQKKIIFELKDVGTFSGNLAKKTLSEAIDNRNATFGVLVVKNVEALSKDISWFQEIDDDKLVMALGSKDDDAPNDELLLIAYKWARARIRSQNTKDKVIDSGFIVNTLKQVSTEMDKLKPIKTECSNITKSAKKIKDSVDDRISIINEYIEQIDKSLNKTNS